MRLMPPAAAVIFPLLWLAYSTALAAPSGDATSTQPSPQTIDTVEKARKALTMADALGPRNPMILPILESLAEFYKETQNYEGLDTVFNRLGAISPQTAQTYMEMAKVDWYRHRLPEAESLIKKALEIEPRNSDALEELGRILIDQERFDEAIKALERAASMRPTEDAQLYNSLGLAYQMKGDYDRALWAYAKAEKTDQTAEALIRAGYLYVGRHQFEKAEGYFKEYLKRVGRKSEGYVHLGAYYYLSGQRAKAEESFRLSVQNALHENDLPPNDLSHKYFWVGIVSEDAGKSAEAVEMYRKALESAARGSELWGVEVVKLGRLYSRLGRMDQTAGLYSPALKTCRETTCSPHAHAELLLAFADLQIQTRRGIKAQDALDAALKEYKKDPVDAQFKPDPEFFQCRVAELYRKLGKTAKAESLFKEAIKTAGPARSLRLARALNGLASLEVEESRTVEAESFYRQALSIFREYPDEESQVSRIAEALDALAGRPEKASR